MHLDLVGVGGPNETDVLSLYSLLINVYTYTHTQVNIHICVYMCVSIYTHTYIHMWPYLYIVYVGQRRDVFNGVIVSCFLAIFNQSEGTNAAPGFVFCATVNIRVSTLNSEHALGPLKLGGTLHMTEVPRALSGAGWYSQCGCS